MKGTTNTLLLIGFALCLLQIWLPAYYLTGDGPCHVYNAQILHDLWSNKNVTLYDPFFSLVYEPNPNWIATLVIALLLFIVKGVVAEKIFLSAYVVLYVSGFYLLLKKISSGNSWWQLALLLFVFPLTLAKGFYNFSFSIAFYFWMVWSWLHFLEKKSMLNASLFFLFTAFIFFTHLLAFGFAVITCGALLLSYTFGFAEGSTREKIKGYFLKNALALVLFLLPFILLMRWFTGKQGGMQMELRHHFYRLVELVQCKFLVNVTHREIVFALIAGILLALMFCIAMLKFKNYRSINKYDGFLLALLCVLFVYLFFPEAFLGRLILISMRAQLFVLILVTCSIAYIIPAGKLKDTAGGILFACFVALSIVRINCQLTASAGVVDYLSAGKYMKPSSVVLPLNFFPQGKDEQGKPIADRNYLFSHPTGYLGTEKPLIILDNYEANMGYFPLRWKEKTNAYYKLGTGIGDQDGIEGYPPSADIIGYRQNSGVVIDYILMWCYDSTFLDKGHFRSLYDQVNSGYHLVYTSPSKRTLLFEKN